ncbi:MAG: L-2-amino-thiazoline-4-carboxylic acid hydrolase [Myxococcota bacterium]|nr:L-2-amino-thiazoline-4-carboxylic acid hydrolase [Myxococcota bacterium]
MLRVKWASLKVLVKRCGWSVALRVGLGVTWDGFLGRPFGGLPRATERQEQESRAQLGPAVLLFLRLSKLLGKAQAFDVTAATVEAGAHAFLRTTVGPIERASLAHLDPDQRHRYLTARLDKFPNALFRVDDVGVDGVHFTVTRCRFVELCHALGIPHLAPVFCAGDASYFGQIQPGVRLHRPQTLAQGGSSCPFHLTWIDESPSQSETSSTP